MTTDPTPMTEASVEEIVGVMTPAQRACGDVIDNLPCDYCGATTLRACTLTIADRRSAADLINSNPGVMNHLRRLSRQHLLKQGGRDGE